MRTVDPELWVTNLKKLPISRTFGKKVNRNFEGLLRKSFRKTIKEYVCNTTYSVLRRLFKNNAHHEKSRCLPRCLLAGLLAIGAAVLCLSAYLRDTVPPYVVTLPFIEHSIEEIEFPAVAICSYNVLSKYLLEDYARELYIKDRRKKYSKKMIYENLLNFGRLVDFTPSTSDIDFTQYLRRVDPERGNNITNLILRLSIPCEKQLVHCSWRGVQYNCSDIFALRPTAVGFCCVFNGRYLKYDLNNEPRFLSVVGQEDGLGVIIKINVSDFTYMRKPVHGSEVLIFDPNEFPMQQSGSVRSYSAAVVNVSSFFVLSAVEQAASKSVKYIGESRRGCRFKDAQGVKTTTSSYNWCLTICRRNAIKELCGCVPFYLMPRPNHFICSLNQLSCLNKHKEKLLIYFPTGDDWSQELSEEFADALDCPHCLPDCTKIRFQATVYTTRYYDNSKLFNNYFTTNVTLGNTTVLRMFYSTEDQLLYMLESTERWYETLAVMGSDAVILLGVTLMMIPELLFFLTIRWRYHYAGLKKPDAFIKVD